MSLECTEKVSNGKILHKITAKIYTEYMKYSIQRYTNKNNYVKITNSSKNLQIFDYQWSCRFSLKKANIVYKILIMTT